MGISPLVLLLWTVETVASFPPLLKTEEKQDFYVTLHYYSVIFPMSFVKGQPKPPLNGRKKGTKNKFPSSLAAKVKRAMEPLKKKGKDLATLICQDSKWFAETFIKTMLPKEINL